MSIIISSTVSLVGPFISTLAGGRSVLVVWRAVGATPPNTAILSVDYGAAGYAQIFLTSADGDVVFESEGVASTPLQQDPGSAWQYSAFTASHTIPNERGDGFALYRSEGESAWVSSAITLNPEDGHTVKVGTSGWAEKAANIEIAAVWVYDTARLTPAQLLAQSFSQTTLITTGLHTELLFQNTANAGDNGGSAADYTVTGTPTFTSNVPPSWGAGPGETTAAIAATQAAQRASATTGLSISMTVAGAQQAQRAAMTASALAPNTATIAAVQAPQRASASAGLSLSMSVAGTQAAQRAAASATQPGSRSAWFDGNSLLMTGADTSQTTTPDRWRLLAQSRGWTITRNWRLSGGTWLAYRGDTEGQFLAGSDCATILSTTALTDAVWCEDNYTFRWIATAQTIQRIQRFYELARRGNPNVQGYVYAPWLNAPRDGTLSQINAWVAFEREHVKASCIAVCRRIDDYNLAQGRSDRLKPIPAGSALAELVSQACNGTVAGLTQSGDVNATMREIFSDDVHMTPTGAYFLTCVIHAAITGENPYGSTDYPDFTGNPTTNTTRARSLETIAWTYHQSFFASGPFGPAMNSAARLAIADTLMSSYVERDTSANESELREILARTNSTNPYWGDSDIWLELPPDEELDALIAAMQAAQRASATVGLSVSASSAAQQAPQRASVTAGLTAGASIAAQQAPQRAAATAGLSLSMTVAGSQAPQVATVSSGLSMAATVAAQQAPQRAVATVVPSITATVAAVQAPQLAAMTASALASGSAAIAGLQAPQVGSASVDLSVPASVAGQQAPQQASVAVGLSLSVTVAGSQASQGAAMAASTADPSSAVVAGVQAPQRASVSVGLSLSMSVAGVQAPQGAAMAAALGNVLSMSVAGAQAPQSASAAAGLAMSASVAGAQSPQRAAAGFGLTITAAIHGVQAAQVARLLSLGDVLPCVVDGGQAPQAGAASVGLVLSVSVAGVQAPTVAELDAAMALSAVIDGEQSPQRARTKIAVNARVAAGPWGSAQRLLANVVVRTLGEDLVLISDDGAEQVQLRGVLTTPEQFARVGRSMVTAGDAQLALRSDQVPSWLARGSLVQTFAGARYGVVAVHNNAEGMHEVILCRR